jgi:RNA polymerase sigma factor (TIGR02999 family)
MGGKLRQNRSRLVAGAYTAAEVSDNTGQVSRLLREWMQGDERAHDELVPIVYGTLRRLAQHYLADERHAQTLQPTALVHEAYLRLVDQRKADWRGRAHFFGVAAQVMRRILVDHARRHLAGKRGEGIRPVSIDEAMDTPAVQEIPILDLDAAIDRLAQLDAGLAQIVELRAFGGLTIDEAAHVLNVSPSTAKREWRTAKAWLTRELGVEGRSDEHH